MSSPANTLSSQNWPVSYRQNPKLALSQSDPTHIAMAQVVVDFGGKQLTYNARTFTIPMPLNNPPDPPNQPNWYFVSIYDPALAGDLPGQTNLSAFYIDGSQQNGQPGYVYIGQIAVWQDPTKAIVGPGGWRPGSGA